MISLPLKRAAVFSKPCYCGTKFIVISLSHRAGLFKMQFYLENDYFNALSEILCSLCLSDSNIKSASNEYQKKLTVRHINST